MRFMYPETAEKLLQSLFCESLYILTQIFESFLYVSPLVYMY